MAKGRHGDTLGSVQALFHSGTTVGLTDGQLLERFRCHGGGAREVAFAALVERHGPMVVRACRAILRDEHEAQDAFQATFLVLARKAGAGTLRVRDSVAPWLHQVAYRTSSCARATASRRKRHERRAAEMADRSVAVEGPDDTGEVLHEEVGRLPERYRAVIVLCGLEGLTHQQAAGHLDLPVGTVQSRLARGREHLRGRLMRRGLMPSTGLLAAASSRDAAATEVSAALAGTTVRAAGRLAAGEAAADVASAAIVVLIRGASRSMSLSMMKTIGTIALATGAIAVGAGLLAQGIEARARPDEEVVREEPRAVTIPPRQGAPAPALKSQLRLVAGVVRDVAGKPVSDATVVVRLKLQGTKPDAGREDRRIIRSGPDGRFRTEFDLAGGADERPLVNVVAYKEGLAPASTYVSQPPPVPARPQRAGEMFLMRDERIRESVTARSAEDIGLELGPSEPFVGTVEDREGRPLAGAVVRFENLRLPLPDGTATHALGGAWSVVQNTPLERLFRVVSDEKGVFRFPALPAKSHALLLVTAKGMADLRTRYPVEPLPLLEGYLTGTPDAPAKIAMTPGARVRGRVTTKLGGVTLSGLKVFLQPSGQTPVFHHAEAMTDASGRFEMDGLVEGTGNIFLRDHPGAGPWTYHAVKDAELRPGEITNVEIELIEGVLVEGKVIDLDTDRPLGGTHVFLHGPIRPRSGAAVIGDPTDENGRYRFRLPPGECYLYVGGPPPGYDRLPGDGSSQTVEIPAGPRKVPLAVPPIPLRKIGDG